MKALCYHGARDIHLFLFVSFVIFVVKMAWPDH